MDLLIELSITDVSKFETKEVFLCHSVMVDYTSANHALLSDPRLEHLLLRYPQNRGSGGLLPMAPRQTPQMLLAQWTFASPMVDYTSANHALLSDPQLEHLLRYPQNRGSGSLLHASPVAPRQTPGFLPDPAQ